MQKDFAHVVAEDRSYTKNAQIAIYAIDFLQKSTLTHYAHQIINSGHCRATFADNNDLMDIWRIGNSNP